MTKVNADGIYYTCMKCAKIFNLSQWIENDNRGPEVDVDSPVVRATALTWFASRSCRDFYIIIR